MRAGFHGYGTGPCHGLVHNVGRKTHTPTPLLGACPKRAQQHRVTLTKQSVSSETAEELWEHHSIPFSTDVYHEIDNRIFGFLSVFVTGFSVHAPSAKDAGAALETAQKVVLDVGPFLGREVRLPPPSQKLSHDTFPTPELGLEDPYPAGTTP